MGFESIVKGRWPGMHLLCQPGPDRGANESALELSWCDCFAGAARRFGGDDCRETNQDASIKSPQISVASIVAPTSPLISSVIVPPLCFPASRLGGLSLPPEGLKT